MTKIIAAITTSVDGYITGPNDGPGNGLGDGGERLHYWVFGGPWSYDGGHHGEMTGADKEFFDGLMANIGLAQARDEGRLETPLLTSGDDLKMIAGFLKGRTSYSAADVLEALLEG